MQKIAYLCTRNKASARWQPCCNRDVAQLVAHYVRDVGVASSNPVIPTKESFHDAILSIGNVNLQVARLSKDTKKPFLYSI